MKITVTGYPRIGRNRELKKATEAYFKGKISAQDLEETAAALRKENRDVHRKAGLDLIPVGDFSFYDGVLDTAVLLGAVPGRYRDLGTDALDTYFAMAHGHQDERGDVRALAMKKWFNTNYHYLVPEIDGDTVLSLHPEKLLGEVEEALADGLTAEQLKIQFTGPFTFLKLAVYEDGRTAADYADAAAELYGELLSRLPDNAWVQFEEPYLVRDIDEEERQLFLSIYRQILSDKHNEKILLDTYFGDIRDVYQDVVALPFDGIGLDFIEGRSTAELVQKNGFPADKVLFAGIVNGKNIWRTSYRKALALVPSGVDTVLTTSCSLLHVPYTVQAENRLPAEVLRHFAFAEEKLTELSDLKKIAEGAPEKDSILAANDALFSGERTKENPDLKERIASLTEEDFTRKPDFYEREKIQHAEFGLPLLPTTTIGSFPQTADVRANRKKFRNGEITRQQYDDFNRQKIRECIELQERIGLDVLVHGEYERNDMVEYFGDHLEGFLFTENGWVQSYGTRCVKPPVIWGDVARKEPITVATSTYAQSLTKKNVKGMLTGPVTILNWSFPREDLPKKEQTFQIALAIREEVLDLEKNGIRIIQIDEAALREKLPLRKSDWHSEYLDWAIPAFRLVHSGVKPETQIHTHMCYSEFGDIISDIDAMDADVITFEASRSDLRILSDLKAAGFRTEVGPGVYDIHSPRIPSEEEIEKALRKMLEVIPKEKLWVNPDCGLKTRGTEETVPSLEHLVAAAKAVRKTLG